jgi:hypothetical protein
MPITSTQVDAVNTATFAYAEDIDTWSQRILGNHFLPWFNTNFAGKGPWAGVTLVDTPQNRLGFHAFWNNIDDLTGSTATPFQFLCLMSIFANECRADFSPKAERMGRAGFPGLCYLFDAIPSLKRSYNTISGNKPAYDCFNSRAFNATHGNKALASRVSNTTDVRWRGEAYPRADFPTDPDPSVTGYILEADFMKFRGRGFIQTTGRANYVRLIDFVQKYQGENNTLDYFALQWRNLPLDAVADTGSNDDWDRLFMQSDLIIPAKAIGLHNQSCGNYLALSGDPDQAAFNMGKRISGGDNYANTFRDRVRQVMDLLVGPAG